MLLVLLVVILLSIPAVQTVIAKKVTTRLNKDFGTSIHINRLGLNWKGEVDLRGAYIEDHHKDTLIYANSLQTSILSAKNLIDGNLDFGFVDIDGVKFYMKTYKGEEDDNLNIFVDKFDSDKPKSNSVFKLNINEIDLLEGKVKIIDQNLKSPNIFILNNVAIKADNLKVLGPNVNLNVNDLLLKAKRGFEIESLATIFSYTNTNLDLKNLNLISQQSNIKGTIGFSYDEEKGMSDFENNVIINAELENTQISSNDLNSFYDEFGKNMLFNLNGNIDGTLNDFAFNNARVNTKGIKIVGDFIFKDLLTSEKDFFITAKGHTITASSISLRKFMPIILGKTLPRELDALGTVKFKGNSTITRTNLKTKSTLSSAIGYAKTDVEIDKINDIENARYIGDVLLTNFNLGKLIKSESFGITTSNLHINGKGFSQETLDTKVTGTVDSFMFEGYDYQSITVSGNLKAPMFDGELDINDPNLKMNFKGLVKVSDEANLFDFKANVDFAELNKLNIIKRDSVSIFAGNVAIKANGKTLDDTYGTISFKQTFYQNEKEDYYFDDFNIVSTKDGVKRKIKINSPDIITGEISGEFLIKDIPSLFINGFGSIYANYAPKEVTSNQYIDFDFLIYNKLVGVFVPQIQFGDNTKIKGSVFSDDSKFILDFKSPEMLLYNNYLGKVNLQLDNHNASYNTMITVDSLYTGSYNLKNVNIVNKTLNDTLHVDASFSGGKKKEDLFNLKLYHTINPEGKSVVGINKSEITYKNNIWYLNENNNRKNKVIFDNDFKNINFEAIVLNHNNEIIEFAGSIQENLNKNLTANFKNVKIENLTPEIDRLLIKGNINGNLSVLQKQGLYYPASTIIVDNININNIEYGNLNVDINGNDDLTHYNLNATLINNTVKSINAVGSINISEGNPLIYLDVNLDKFNLNAVSPFGGTAITDIRGFISGNVNASGNLKSPDIVGDLTLNKSGMKIPYLNIDFELDDYTKVAVTSNKLEILKTHITDTKHNTHGELYGFFNHDNYNKWKTNLTIKSDNLLVLDTPKTEEALYYGTAYISGVVDLKGPLDEMIINVEATTEEGTVFKIPLSDTESIGDNSFIHFLSPDEKRAKLRGETIISDKVKGLSLNFDLDINNNAEVEIVIDQESKSALRGRGAGFLLIEINTLGKFNMWGDFIIYEGVYDFRYGKIIQREIEVERDGTITWDGSPSKAELNIKAIYKTRANPSALLDDPTINRKIPVEVIVDLTNEISQPDLVFDIRFPEVSSTVRSELEYKLQTQEERQNQALYLLTTGGFISAAAGENALANTLNQGINALFAEILSDDDAIVNITPYYDIGFDTVDLKTEDELGVQFSTQISKRIIVNGKVGIPVGGLSETRVAGDVDVQWLVNDDGSLRLNFFNRQSELQFIGEDQTFEQGAGISYSVDFNTFKELVKKIFGTNIELESETDTNKAVKNDGPVVFKSKPDSKN